MILEAVAALPSEVKDQTKAACARYGVPEDNVRAVLWWVHRLRHFESAKDDLAVTSTKRVRALVCVADAAKQLEDALDALSVADQAQLQEAMQMAEAGLPPTLRLWKLPHARAASRVRRSGAGMCHDTQHRAIPADVWMQIRSVLSRVSWTATMLEEQMRASAKGGRRPVLQHYAGFVEGLWGCARGSGLRLARSGKFQQFCSEIFSIAGVPSNAEGAVRHFIESRNKQAD
jgi:hypothetical protein